MAASQALPAVSVLMPVYNAVPYLEDALASLAAQTYTSWELIAVDDGSTDGSSGILERFAVSSPNHVVHLRQENLGGAAARDRAARQARGSLLAFFDADDVSFPRRLELQTRYLEEHPETSVVASAVRRIDKNGRRLGRLVTHAAGAPFERLLDAGLTPVLDPTVLMRSAAYRDAGGYRPIFRSAYDLDLWFRVALDGGSFAALAAELVAYRCHDNQTVSARSALTQYSRFMAVASARCRLEGRPDPVQRWNGTVGTQLLDQSRLLTDAQRSTLASLLVLSGEAGDPDITPDVSRRARQLLMEGPIGTLPRGMSLGATARAAWVIRRSHGADAGISIMLRAAWANRGRLIRR